MKKFLWIKPYLLIASLIFSCLSLTWQNSQAAELTGQQIVNQSYKLNDLPYEANLLRMTTIDSSGYKNIRTLRIYSRLFRDSLYKYLVVFDAPAGIKGTALLTWQNRHSSDDQWLYLPAIGKLKRIAHSEKSNYFMGTDFTYQDLSSNKSQYQQYTRLKDAKIGGVDVYIIKDQPRETQLSLSRHAYRKLYFSKRKFTILRIDFLNRKGTLLKRETFTGFKKVRGRTAWRPTTITMNNYVENRKTIMTILKRNYSNEGAPASYFTKHHLYTKQHVGS